MGVVLLLLLVLDRLGNEDMVVGSLPDVVHCNIYLPQLHGLVWVRAQEMISYQLLYKPLVVLCSWWNNRFSLKTNCCVV